MIGNLSGLFDNVVAEFTKATELLSPTHGAMDAIYWEYKPQEVGVLGQTINVAIPQDPSNQVQDIGVNDLVLSDVAFETTPIVFNRHPSFAFAVKDYEQFLTPFQIQQNFVKASFTGIQNHINATVTSLFTSANFVTNPVISATGGLITVPQFLSAKATLIDQNVPVNGDPRDMTLLLPSVPYTLMQDATTGGSAAAWSQAFIVGQNTASEIHDKGTVPVAFNTSVQVDQQMPTRGTTGSRTFTGALFHKFAVAGASRAIGTPPQADKVAEFTYIDWKGMSLRVMLSYSHFPKGGLIFSVDCGYGLKVVRENLGTLFSIAE